MAFFPRLLSMGGHDFNPIASRVYPLADEFGFGFPHRYYNPCPALQTHSASHSVIQPKNLKNEITVSPVGKDGFQVSMDVQQFKPNELTVKTVDNCVVIEGKHEEREDDHGYITRHFVRKYTLPKGYDPNDAISTISSDGVLTVKVPVPTKSKDAKERIVQIQHTGPAHISVKENPKEDSASQTVRAPAAVKETVKDTKSR